MYDLGDLDILYSNEGVFLKLDSVNYLLIFHLCVAYSGINLHGDQVMEHW